MPEPLISVIVVTHNHAAFLTKCLDALVTEVDRLDGEIIVVDNRSDDDSAGIARNYPQVRLHINEERRGLAANNNYGMALTRGRYILLLNPDTEARPGSLEKLIRFMEDHPRVGLCGPQLLFPSGEIQPSARRFPTLWTVIARRTPLRFLFRRSSINRRHLMLEADLSSSASVDWLLGACLLVRREALDEVGPMDEGYFLYVEDIDWARRMHQAGWDVYYVPTAQVVHQHLAVSDKRFFSRETRLHTCSMVRYALKYLFARIPSSMPPYRQRLIRIDWRRRIAAFLLGIAAAVLRSWRCVFKPRNTHHKSRDIVILEPFGMGDMVSLEPLVRVLKHEGFAVHMCAREAWQPIFPKEHISSRLDAEIPWSSYDLKKKYAWRSIFGTEFRNFLRNLHGICEGTIGFDTRGDIRSVLLLHLAGCREVYALSHYLGSDLRVAPAAARIIAGRNDLPRWRLNLEFLRAVNVNPDSDIQPPSVEHLKKPATGKTTRRVALIPISPWPARCWEETKWKELAQKISDLGLNPMGLCGPGQLAKSKENLGNTMEIKECAEVQDWIDELQPATAVVTVNTGPMHLADALHKPLVVVNGPCKLPLWLPSNRKSRVIHHQDVVNCSPCHLVDHGDRCGRECMELITVNEVVHALTTMTEL